MSADIRTKPQEIGVDQILLLPNVPAGMNPLVLMHLAYLLRSRNDHEIPPIEVWREGANYRLKDGRHRYMAHVIAGRQTVQAVIILKTQRPGLVDL
jgi:hypothetical protein